MSKVKKCCQDHAANVVSEVQNATVNSAAIRNLIDQDATRLVQYTLAEAMELLGGYKESMLNEIAKLVDENDIGQCDILPNNVRFVKSQRFESRRVLAVVVEFPPAVRTVNAVVDGEMAVPYHGEEDEDIKQLEITYDQYDEPQRIKQYQLAFPYTVFVVYAAHTIGNNDKDQYTYLLSKAFFSNKPITSVDDQMQDFQLPNIHDNNNVCLAQNFESNNLGNLVNDVVAYFWNSVFTSDAADQFNYDLLESLAEWEKRSKQDALFPLKLKFPQAGTIGEEVQSGMKCITDGENSYRGTQNLRKWFGDVNHTVLRQLQQQTNNKSLKIALKTATTRILQNALFEANSK